MVNGVLDVFLRMTFPSEFIFPSRILWPRYVEHLALVDGRKLAVLSVPTKMFPPAATSVEPALIPIWKLTTFPYLTNFVLLERVAPDVLVIE